MICILLVHRTKARSETTQSGPSSFLAATSKDAEMSNGMVQKVSKSKAAAIVPDFSALSIFL